MPKRCVAPRPWVTTACCAFTPSIQLDICSKQSIMIKATTKERIEIGVSGLNRAQERLSMMPKQVKRKEHGKKAPKKDGPGLKPSVHKSKRKRSSVRGGWKKPPRHFGEDNLSASSDEHGEHVDRRKPKLDLAVQNLSMENEKLPWKMRQIMQMKAIVESASTAKPALKPNFETERMLKHQKIREDMGKAGKLHVGETWENYEKRLQKASIQATVDTIRADKTIRPKRKDYLKERKNKYKSRNHRGLDDSDSELEFAGTAEFKFGEQVERPPEILTVPRKR